MFSKKFLGGSAAAAIAFALSTPTVAIAQQTTSSVSGEVRNDSGQPISGATVTVIHEPSGTRATQETEPNGTFDVRGLRVGGPYTIEVSAPSFGDETVTGIMLGIGSQGGYSIALTPADRTVTVTAKRAGRLIDPGTRTMMNREAIGEVTTTRRDIRDLTRRDPLVTLDNVTRGTGPAGGIYIAGSTPRLNRITIDGVRSADDFGLNTGGLSTTRGPISIEAIEQLAVQAVPFDVAEGDFTGGAVNIVLRGGGNDFSGSVFTNYQNDGLTGVELNNKPAPIATSLQNYGAFLSGPVWKDKLFFAASYEYFKSLDAVTTFGPGDLGFLNKNNGIGGTAAPSLTSSQLSPIYTAWDTYASAKSFAIGTFPTTTPTRDIKDSLRLDFNITDDQRLQAIYRHAESSLYKPFGSATSIGPNTNWYIQGELEDNYSLQLNSSWTNALSTEARMSYRSYIRHQDPPEGQGFAQITVCLDPTTTGDLFSCGAGTSLASSSANLSPSGQPSIGWGPDQFRQANVLKTKNTSEDINATYKLGDHTFKAGVQNKAIEIFNVFVAQANGLYYFDSVADFQAGKAGRFQYQNNPGGDPNAAAAVLGYSVTSLFAQDSWRLLDNLTVNGGLRYDFYRMDDKPALNPNFVGRFGFNNQTTYDGLDVLMPRLSFKYDPADNIQVSGGVGLFSGGLPDVFLSNRFSNTGILTNGIDIQRLGDGTFRDNTSSTVVATATGNSLLNINKANAAFGVGVPNFATPLLAVDSVARRTAETNSFAPNFKMPSDWKGNLAFKYDKFGARFGVDLIASVSQDNVAFRDIRARPLTVNGVQQVLPDGRIRYDGLNVSAAQRTINGLPVSTNPDLVNLGSSRDIQAYNPGKDNWSRTLALSASKSWESLGIEADVAYIVQKAENFGALTEFSTTDSGFYGDAFSSEDPNTSTTGIASNRIRDTFKASVSYRKNLFGDLKSKFSLFGESRAGRPFSFVGTDASSSSRGPVFGVNRSDQLLYVPNVNSPDAGNPLKFTSPSGTVVFFDNATTLANFKNVVANFRLPVNGIVPKGYGENPRINQIDFQFDQELPAFREKDTLHLTMDVKNVLNLLNNRWGLVQEYGDSRGGTGNRVVSVSCATVTGTAIGADTALCPAYRYTNFNSSPGSVGSGIKNQDTSSRWYLQVGLKYAF